VQQVRVKKQRDFQRRKPMTIVAAVESGDGRMGDPGAIMESWGVNVVEWRSVEEDLSLSAKMKYHPGTPIEYR
jgi:hypothetical protein